MAIAASKIMFHLPMFKIVAHFLSVHPMQLICIVSSFSVDFVFPITLLELSSPL